MTDDCIDCPEHYEQRAVDNSTWDGGAAMSNCASKDSPAGCYNSICAGKKAGDPNLQSSHALPHHKTPGAPPNAAGVRNALARLPQTQGLTNKQAAQAHLQAHMSSIQGQSTLRPVDADTRMVEYGGKTMTLRTLVDAWDTARREHYILDPRPLTEIKVTELRAGTTRGGFQVKGYASVFDALSHDLGGFREKIQPGFFAPVLERNPDVHALWDHDTRYVLGRTSNGTLDLREDPKGLYNWIKVAPTSYAQDLRLLLERGDIDQASFAFNVEEDEFAVDDEDNVVRTLIRARDLYDVTVTAQGAYPQSSSEVVARSIRSVLDLGRNVYAVGSGAADKAIAAIPPADGAAASQAVSEEDDEAFEMWRKAMEKKAAARRATLAKLAERMEKLK
jgi:hypothetical protein